MKLLKVITEKNMKAIINIANVTSIMETYNNKTLISFSNEDESIIIDMTIDEFYKMLPQYNNNHTRVFIDCTKH